MAAPMAAPSDQRGKAASPGRAQGPAYVAHDPAAETASPANGDARNALEAAVTQAVEDLRALSARADTESAGVLDFQIDMLLDDEILTPALERIAKGSGAALAWAGAMNAYIDAFTDDSAATIDDPFAVKVADLTDLKNRVLDVLAGRPPADFPTGSVYVGHDLPPSLFLTHDWSKGGAIALTAGSAVSHVAMLARTRGVPMVIGLGPLPVTSGQTLLVDGTKGLVRIDPAEPAEPSIVVSLRASAPATQPAPRAGDKVRLCVNINTLSDLDMVDPATVDGVGLVRTEFMFRSAAEALNEERHLDYYRRIVAHLKGRPVTLRMLDLGGDKALPGLVDGSPGSFLGQRGIRLLLAYPELARIQARALMRVAVEGPVNVLLPMVTVPEEVAAMALLFIEEADRLARLGVPALRPPLGMMIEVPAAALTLDLFSEAAFFSVGTNDLMQYLSAAARDNPTVAPLNARSETALFRLMDQVCASASALGKPVSVCGDLAGDPQGAARLLGGGFRDLSVAPARLAAIRAMIRAGEPMPADRAGR